jgi:LmbE family N-acetylglucosaminyl deacetylase
MHIDAPFLGKKILVVTAHPDDESFIAAGAIHENNQRGGSTHVLCATHGGNGRAHLDREHTEAELKQRRRDELVAVTQVLGISDYEVLDYPDGQLADFETEFGHDIARVVQDWKPDVLLTFGPDGFTGHRDHIAIHGAALHAAGHFSVPFVTAVLPPMPQREVYRQALCGKRKCESYHDEGESPEPNITMPVSKEIKLQALQCYASQWKGLDPHAIFPPELAEHFLTYEHFVV